LRHIRDIIAGWNVKYDSEMPDVLSDPVKAILGDDPK